MMALMLALAAASPAPPSLPVWRVVDRPGLHIGARPALLVTNDGPETAAGATVQVTTFFL
jgi:hypothetical protein